MNKLILLPAIGTVFSLLSANAAVIFDANTTNSGVVDNNVNAVSHTVTGSTGALVVTTVTDGNNNAAGLVSNDNINTLLGRSLVSTDTVTMKLGISSTTGNIRSNGIEFGMSPTAPVVSPDTDVTDFRPASNLIFQIDDGGAVSGMALGNFPGTGINAAGFGITEGSMANGFCVTLVADNSGYTFTFDDIQQQGNTSVTTLSFSGTFTGTQFVDNFGGSHIYYTRQLPTVTGTGGVTNISEFSIDVVPEPSTALLSFLGFTGLLRRCRTR